MDKIKSSIEIKAQRTVWKQQYGNEAVFKSRDGYEFNVFDDSWTLAHSASGRHTVKTDWLHSSQFDNLTQCDLRMAWGFMSSENAPATTQGYISALKTNAIPNLKTETLEGYWASFKANKRSKIKSVVSYLYDYKPERYQQQHDWIQKQTVQITISNPYDPTTGALSDIESQSFDLSLNQRMTEKLSEISRGDLRAARVQDADHLRDVSRYIILRLLQVLVRRPIQLSQLKWSDIIPVGKSFNDDNVTDEYCFSDEKELHVRIWRSKTKGNYFRSHAEGYPIRLNASISKEVLIYKMAYCNLFQQSLHKNGIRLTQSEMDELIVRCPVIAADDLFSTGFASKKALFTALGESSPSFHKSSDQITELYKFIYKHLAIKSDRLPAEDVKITNNRIRHTVATNAAREGKSAILIAGILGSSPKTVKATYIDLSNEQRSNIDDKFLANDMLIQSFSTSVQERQKSKEFLITDEFGNEAGQVKSRQQCNQCNDFTNGKPVACYGCDNFTALLTGDHQSILDKAETLYQSRKKIGELPAAMKRLEMQIRFIEITILVCARIPKKEICHAE